MHIDALAFTPTGLLARDLSLIPSPRQARFDFAEHQPNMTQQLVEMTHPSGPNPNHRDFQY